MHAEIGIAQPGGLQHVQLLLQCLIFGEQIEAIVLRRNFGRSAGRGRSAARRLDAEILLDRFDDRRGGFQIVQDLFGKRPPKRSSSAARISIRSSESSPSRGCSCRASGRRPVPWRCGGFPRRRFARLASFAAVVTSRWSLARSGLPRRSVGDCRPSLRHCARLLLLPASATGWPFVAAWPFAAANSANLGAATCEAVSRPRRRGLRHPRLAIARPLPACRRENPRGRRAAGSCRWTSWECCRLGSARSRRRPIRARRRLPADGLEDFAELALLVPLDFEPRSPVARGRPTSTANAAPQSARSRGWLRSTVNSMSCG